MFCLQLTFVDIEFRGMHEHLLLEIPSFRMLFIRSLMSLSLNVICLYKCWHNEQRIYFLFRFLFQQTFRLFSAFGSFFSTNFNTKSGSIAIWDPETNINGIVSNIAELIRYHTMK